MIYKKFLNVKPGDFSATRYSSFEFVSCTLNTVAQKIMIVIVYRKQEVSFSIFCEELEKFLDSMPHKGNKVIIVGDFHVWIEQGKY